MIPVSRTDDDARAAALLADSRDTEALSAILDFYREESAAETGAALEALSGFRSVSPRLADPNDLSDAELTAMAAENAIDDAGWSADEIEFAAEMGRQFRGDR